MGSYLAPHGRLLHIPSAVTLVGQPGLHLMDVPSLLARAITGPRTAFIVFHAGTNDIDRLASIDWHRQVQSLVHYITVTYPRSVLIWSMPAVAAG